MNIRKTAYLPTELVEKIEALRDGRSFSMQLTIILRQFFAKPKK